MGKLVRLSRKRPARRDWRQVQAEEAIRESAESRRSLFILVLAFSATAIAMSVAVVVAISNTWADVVMMTVVVLVFALLKIALADAAFWVMLRADDESEKAAAAKAAQEAEAALPVRRRPPERPARPLGPPSRPMRKTPSTRLALLVGKPLAHPPARPEG